MPFFSIIIPTYNRLPLLRQTLESVWAQRFADYKVIVVDDGSTDGTWEELQALGSRVRALRQQNAGPGAARNLGAQHSTGEYLAFLDSDDVWFPWTLETYASVIRAQRAPAFIAGKPFRFHEETELRGVKLSPVQTNNFSDYLASGSEWRWWGVSSFVIRRDVFEAAGKFANEWVNGEDADLALRLGVAPGFVQVTNPVTFGYREHDGSAMKNLSKTLAGTWLGIHTEQAGKYPGGGSRSHERWRIITRHARPVTFDCLLHGLHNDAWKLYRAMVRWHVALGRWKYLVGFPMKALIGRIK